MEPIKGEFPGLFRKPRQLVHTRRVRQIACKESRQIICKVTDHALHPACNAMKTNKSREKCHQFVATPMLHSCKGHRSRKRPACPRSRPTQEKNAQKCPNCGVSAAQNRP